MEQQFDKEAIYQNLADKAKTHFGETSLSKIASIGEYESNKETHDFDKVYFEARPNMMTTAIVDTLASKILKNNRRYINDEVVVPFLSNIDEAEERLEDGRLFVMTGHQTMFEPGYAMYGLQRALAKTGRKYQDVARDTHLIATRALATVDILGRYPVTSLARQIANVYYTLPRTKNYQDIPEAFSAEHNNRTKREFSENTRKLGSIGVMSAAATTEKPDERGIYEIQPITGGTMRLLRQDWHVWPIGGSFLRKNFKLIPGQIIDASDVDEQTMSQAMSWIAETRNQCGVPAAYVG